MLSSQDNDSHFMNLALEQARLATAHSDIPVGAIVVRDGEVIGVGKNERELLQSPIAHAEVLAIQKAAQAIGSWNLSGCILYVTLEPCVMCSGALVMSRIKEVVYAASDPKGGSISTQIPILQNEKLNHRVNFRQGPFQKEAGLLLTEFFKNLRAQKKAPND